MTSVDPRTTPFRYCTVCGKLKDEPSEFEYWCHTGPCWGEIKDAKELRAFLRLEKPWSLADEIEDFEKEVDGERKKKVQKKSRKITVDKK